MSREMTRDELRQWAMALLTDYNSSVSVAILCLLDDHAALQARNERALALLRAATENVPSTYPQDSHVTAPWRAVACDLLSEPAPASDRDSDVAALREMAATGGLRTKPAISEHDTNTEAARSSDEPAPAPTPEGRTLEERVAALEADKGDRERHFDAHRTVNSDINEIQARMKRLEEDAGAMRVCAHQDRAEILKRMGALECRICGDGSAPPELPTRPSWPWTNAQVTAYEDAWMKWGHWMDAQERARREVK